MLLAGATGYLGRAVARELDRRGYEVLALVRPGSRHAAEPLTEGEAVLAEVTDPASLDQALGERRVDAIISCLASRSGAPRDAWRVDHDANVHLLERAPALGVRRFVLLSALCVQKPRLAFQRAKLAFEARLQAAPVEHVIVRPTAFFKSLAGQVERVRSGRPFLLFGDGRLTACKPISEEDLAAFIVEALEPDAPTNRILPIGGPGPAVTPRQQGEWLFELTGRPQRFRSVSPSLLRGAAALLSPLGRWSDRVEEKAELARIGHYYATESMLVWDESRDCYDAAATPETGIRTLKAFYRRVLDEGLEGQELGAHRLFR